MSYCHGEMQNYNNTSSGDIKLRDMPNQVRNAFVRLPPDLFQLVLSAVSSNLTLQSNTYLAVVLS
jgi:hypothetical protein